MKKRLLSLLMVLCLVLSMLPTSAFAADVEYLDSVYITEHNPLYPHDDCSVEEHAPTVDALHPLEGGQYEDDLSVASAAIREAMKNRQSTVSVNVFLAGDTYDGSDASAQAMMRGIFYDAYAHTGNPTEGDYLRWVYNSMSAGASGYTSGGDYYLTITYNITYYTTAAQEQAVTDKLATVMPAFGFTALTTDYQKVKAIYDYICANVTYDHENLENDSYKLKYTAYAALINGTSVCQGYATLLYRMLLMVGVDARVVTGTAGGGNHGWNIVKLGAYYYNADSTWDAGETEYDYFLTCPANFDPTHTRGADYTTAAFHTAYPMADADYDPITAPGLGDVTGSGSSFAGGTGVESDPYLISTTAHLNNVRDHLGAHFKMTNDIVFTDADFASGGDFYNGGAGWTPIGDNTNKFTGTFDGNGFAIKNLRIDIRHSSLNNLVGLFGYANGATIKNLGMEDCEISVESIRGYVSAGAIAGMANGCTITNCYNIGNISAVSTYATGSANAGGIVGWATNNDTTTITNCYNTGSISASSSAFQGAYSGGIAGYAYGTAITNCYNTGDVSGEDYVGGITGNATSSATISNCYNIGNVSISGSSASAGGILGYKDSSATLTNCYFLDSSEKGVGIGSTTGSYVRTEEAMRKASGFAGFSFTSVWTMSGNTNYPYPELQALHHINCATHKTVNRTGYAATCYTDGLTDGVQCTVCLAWVTPQTVIPAAHSNKDGYCTVCSLPEGMEYYINGNEVTITGYTGTLKEVIVPATINGKTVTSLLYAFEDCTTMEKVVLPNTLTSIDTYAFKGCKALKEITIPPSVHTIGGGAFSDCIALSEIVIPDTVTAYTGASTFDGCTALKKVKLSANADTLPNYAFYDCTALEEITLGGLMSIGDYAFYNCDALQEINIPNSVTTIGQYAFDTCDSLAFITVGTGIKSIGNSAFHLGYNHAADIRFLGNPPVAGLANLTFKGTLYYPCDNYKWTASVLDDLYNIEPVADHTPKTVTGTPNSCFTGGLSDGVQCEKCSTWLTPQTTIPAAHTYSDGYCTVCALPEGLAYTVNGDEVTVTGYTGSLTALVIPETINGKSVTGFAADAFRGLSALTDITIPASVTFVGSNAFTGCTNLSVLRISDLTAWMNIDFNSEDPTAYPQSCNTKLKDLYLNGTKVTALEIPAGTTTIPYKAFSSTTITSVTVPDSVTAIDGEAFSNCEKLTGVTLGSGVKTIGNLAFYKTTALRTLVLPASVESLGKRVFWNSGINSLTFTGKAPAIGDACFQGIRAVVYYPCSDSSWTASVRTSYDAESATWKLTHPSVVTVPGTPGSCYTDGKTDGTKCSSCGVTVTEQTTIPAGHTFVDGYCTACALPEGLTYITYEDRIRVTGYTGTLTELVIPETINGKEVAVLSYGAFENCTTLEKVVLPDTLLSIYNSAFKGCTALKSVNIPAGVTAIGKYAFDGCTALESITLPSRVTVIDLYTFRNCTALESVTLLGDVTAIDSFAFGSCTSLKNINLPDSVKTIGSQAFSSCIALESVALDNVTTIDHSAFKDCTSLSNIHLPETLTSLGNLAFSGCTSLKSITVPASITTIGDHLFNGCTALESVTLLGKVTAIGISAFNGCEALKSIDLPDSVETIGSRAFSSCDVLADIIIPHKVTEIGEYTFAFCKALTDITIPDAVKTVGEYAFEGCSSLESVTFGSGVTQIGKYAFNTCRSLTSITFTGDLPTIGSSCFLSSYGYAATALYPCDNTTWTDAKVAELAAAHTAVTWTADHAPKTVSGTPNSCFTGGLSDGVQCEKCQTWLTPQTPVPAAHDYVGGYCTVCALPQGLVYTVSGDKVTITDYTGTLTELTIPATINGKTVTAIGASAFTFCSSLVKVTLPNSVTKIGSSAFNTCSNLTSVNIPTGVTVIEPFTFQQCSSLTDIDLHENITAVGKYAFANCSALKTIAIPAGVTALEERTFYQCVNLTTVSLPQQLLTIGAHAFSQCTSLKSISIPDTVTAIGDSAFYFCSALEALDLPANLISIGASAFNSCEKLTSVTVPNKVTGIGNEAFQNCDDLTRITFTGDLPTIGSSCFPSSYGYAATAYYPCDNDTWTAVKVAELAAAHTSVTWTADHAPKTVSGTPNSCFTDGLSDGVQCEKCQTWLTPQTPIPAAHTNKDGYCTVCGLPEGLVYNISGYPATLTVTGYTGTLTELVIPATINGTPVKKLYNTFRNNTTITKVTLPEGLEELGNSVFEGCTALKSVNVPSTVTTLTDSVFKNCTSLEAVELPNGITYLGFYVFDGCTALKTVNIPTGISKLNAYTFQSCSSLESITIPDNITDISTCVFFGCSALKSITIPTSVTTIYHMAFANCSALKEITIPATVKSMGLMLFNGCSALEKITFLGDLPTMDSVGGAFSGARAPIFYPCNNESWSAEAVAAMVAAQPLVTFKADHAPKTVTGTPNSCFTGGLSDGVQCTVCEEWLTPQTPIEAGHTFVDGYCTVCGLPEGLQYTITNGEVTVTGYTGTLTKLTVPSHIEGKPVTTLRFNAFEDDITLEEILLPNTLKTVESYAFNGCTALKSIVIPDSVTSLGDGLFSNCTALQSATLPAGITKLPDRLFTGCTALKRYTVPATVTELGASVFSLCTALTEVTCLGSITAVGANAFQACAITAAPFLATAETVGANAFFGCSDLGKVSFGENLTSIGESAFAYCSRLAEIRFAGDYPTIGPVAFGGFATAVGGTDVYYPCDNDTWDAAELTDTTLLRWHADHNGKNVAGYGPTCTVDGKTDGVQCEKCQTWLMPQQPIPAAHTPKTVTGTPNSCFTSGLSDGVQCSVCQTWLTPQTPIEAGHRFANGVCTVCALPEGLVYTVNGDKVTVTGYTGTMTSVTIPAAINGKTVTAIAESAFENCTKLQLIGVPDTVTSIGSAAFKGCTGLKAISLPASVTQLGTGGTFDKGVFQNCTALEMVLLPNDLTVITPNLFDGCTALKNITLPSKVTELGAYAFNGCTALNLVNLSNALTSVGSRAFANCSALEEIRLPAGVTSISNFVFVNCTSLKKVNIPAGVTTIREGTFSGCFKLESITLPEGLLSIDRIAFSNCKALTELTIPASVTSIGDQAFFAWRDMETVTFKGNFPSIHAAAFRSSTAVVRYPCDNTTWTEDKLLAYGGTLEWVPNHNPQTVPGTPNSCFDSGFTDGVQCTICEEWLTPQTRIPAAHNYVGNFCSVCGLPKGLTYSMVGNTVTITRYVGPLTELNIPATINGKPVTAIDDYAFDCGYNLKSISLPDSVTYIGNGAFMSCRALENVNIPSGVTTINSNTFSGCKSLKSVTLPAGVTAIGKYAFDGCTALTSLTIPNGVTSIGMNAFESCTALTGITIPASVTDIGKHAFVFCSRLAEVHFLGNAPIFGPNYFSGVTATAYYPCGDATWTENKLQNNGGSITWVVEHHYVDGVCTGCGEEAPSHIVPGDFTGDGLVTNEDVSYLLWHTLFPADYPLSSPADFTNDGYVTNEDVSYLLWHTLFPADYPLILTSY